MSAPVVPTRPARATAGPTAVKDSIPPVPPRPARKQDPSPIREDATRSPLNELPDPLSRVSTRRSQSHLAVSEVPSRPPIVTLPSVGQEGLEYSSYDQLPAEAHGVPVPAEDRAPETKNVSAHVPLLAPKASVPQSTAKSRIQTVTRTDSTQAAAAGIGKAQPEDDVHKTPAESNLSLSRVSTKNDDLRRIPSTEPHPLKQKTSFSRSSSSLPSGTPKAGSFQESFQEQGIPEIGMQIPLYPNAGDVQAPSPAQTQSQHAPGIGFFNDGSARAHNRKRSSRQEFGPPGSYGLHGHGQDPHDHFEKAWQAKHPDEAAVEGYSIYGNLNASRPETALSSEELNRLVNQNLDIGMGTDPNMIGTPSQEVAFTASEEYSSSPKPSPVPLTKREKRSSSGSQHAVRSPLHKTSFPFDEARRVGAEDAVETEDESVIHVDAPERNVSKITGGGAADNTIDLGPRAGNTEEEGGWFDERGEGTPILASDEILKRPGSAFMQPAVNPEGEEYESDNAHYDSSRRSSLRVPSRPTSRPNSMHGEYQGGNLYRFMSHDEHHASGMGTPLEEIEEYEPLFPEGEEDEQKPKPVTTRKRPGLEHHHFPSQDVWEDTPSSLQYHTTVETPEPPREKKALAPPPSMPSSFKTSEEEQEHREINSENMLSGNKAFAKPHFKAGVQEEVESNRPGMQRFPSRDIWEDSPDSMRLVTTVSGPQMDETKSPPDDRPTTTAIPGSQDDVAARATTGLSQVMSAHTRSKLAEEIKPDLPPEEKEVPDLGEKQSSPDKAKAPAIPDRPKPTVPARPARPSRSEQTEATGAPLAKSFSAESQASDDTVTSPPVPKTKPVVPARPGSQKIAALQAGFMNDLNNRLKLGPQGPPPKTQEAEPEVVEETQKAPLADARKGRAKGPAKRKPAASPSAPAAEEKPVAFSMSRPLTVFHIDENEELQVPGSIEGVVASDLPHLEKALTDNVAHNTSEPALAEPMSPEKAEAALSTHPPDSIGAKGDEPEPSITMDSAQKQKAIEPEFEASLADAEAAPEPGVALEKKEVSGAAGAAASPSEGAHDKASLSAVDEPVVRDHEDVPATEV